MITEVLFRLGCGLRRGDCPRFIFFAAALLATTALANAQKVSPKPTPAPKVMTANEQRLFVNRNNAVAMIEKTAEEAVFWEKRTDAVRAMTEAADLLWNENPARSEKWLTRAWRLTDEILAANFTRQTDPAKEAARASSLGFANRLRQRIVAAALRHDQTVAGKFLKEIADDQKTAERPDSVFADRSARSEMLLGVAVQSIERDPELAVRLAISSLDDGISAGLQSVLNRLHRVRPDLANRIFDAAVATLAASPSNFPEVEILYGYLFQPGIIMMADANGVFYAMARPDEQRFRPAAEDDPQRAANYLRAVFKKYFARAAVSDYADDANGRALLFLSQRLAPRFAALTPELTPVVEAIRRQLLQKFPRDEEKNQFSGERNEEGDEALTSEQRYEKRIARLEKSAQEEQTAELRDDSYVYLIVELKPEDVKRGAVFAGRIENKKLRDDAVSFVYFRAAMWFLSNKDTAAATELLPRVQSGKQRAVVAVSIVKLLQETKGGSVEEVQIRRQTSFEMIADAERALRNDASDFDSAKVLFGLATVSASVDKSRALAAVESAVQNVNEFENFDIAEAGAPWLGIDDYLVSASTVELPRFGFGFENAAAALVDDGFDELASLAERFSAKHTRGTARLLVAKAFFEKNKNLLKQKK